MITVAIPTEYRDDLAPVLVTYELASSDAALDLSTATGARALFTRPDRVSFEWSFAIEPSPAPTATSITVSAPIVRGDLFDTTGAPVPGTYDVRFLVSVPAGEFVLSRTYLAVELF